MNVCFYTTCNSLALGCKLYQENTAITVVPNGFYSDGTICYEVLDGVIVNVTNC